MTSSGEPAEQSATSLGELKRRIALLPEPGPGRVRVFRGQSIDYPTMKPAGLRGAKHVDENAFRAYAQLLAAQLHDAAGAPFDQLRSFFIWVRAIAQHYGPGTEFLDVTKSLDVAVWFAMNRAETHPINAIFGKPGPLDTEHDTPAKLEGLRFRPHEPTGYIYVFDVEEWDPSVGPLKHGSQIDLSTAPEVFSSSPRLQVQEACLLYADRKVGDGELKDLAYVIPISWPLDDWALRGHTTGDLFPTPSGDHWYHRLLSIPHVHRLSSGSSDLEIAQALPVQLYVDPKTWRHTDERLILLEPPLLWPDLRRELEAGSTWLPAGFEPKDAVPILLEFPMFAMTPPLDSGQWHHAVLCEDLPNHAIAVNAETGELETVSLDRVLVEFSPLELARWDEVETTADEIVFWRGAYVEREGSAFRLWLVNQTFPTCQLRVSGPYPFFYDQAAGEMRLGDAEKSMPVQAPAKTLFVVLTLLRELSDVPLACPFPTNVFDGKVFMIRVQGPTARLIKARDPRSSEPIFMVRHPERDEPFSASSNDGGMLVLETANGWLAETMDAFRKALEEAAKSSHGNQ